MQLLVVHVGAEKPLDITGDQTTIRLNECLFLVRSDQTQSQLYHSIKRKLDPSELFVGVLADDPKFKGMCNGALKWLRDRA
jgi:hypothetical protein